MEEQLKGISKDIAEMRKTLLSLSRDVSEVQKQQQTIMSLVEDVKKLKKQNEEIDGIIKTLENRIENAENKIESLEQYSRMNDVIISGLDIKPRSYAHATRQEHTEPTEQDSRSVEEQVSNFFQSKGIGLDINTIEACHLLPRTTTGRHDKPTVIMRFANRRFKSELLKQGRMLKGTSVYLNEHLTKRNAEIAKKARLLRTQKKIQSTWTSNCKIFIKLNGSIPEQAKVLVVRSLGELDILQ